MKWEYWLIFGILLSLIEIFAPTFMFLWFGLGAIVVAAIVAIFSDIPTYAQILIWSGLSIVATWIWFKYIKPLSTDKTMSGLSREAMIGQIGLVTETPHDERKGTLKFPVPILGEESWQFLCEDELELGDKVKVIDISGNSLIVKKYN